MTHQNHSHLADQAQSLEQYIQDRAQTPLHQQFKDILTLCGWDLKALSNSEQASQWGNYAYRVGQRLLALVEQETLNAYHNKGHINQVLSACMLLLDATESEPEEKKDLGMVLALTMLGHDLKHDGYQKDLPLGEREKISASIVEHVFAYESQDLAKHFEEKIKMISNAIAYTEPQAGTALVQSLYRNDPSLPYLLGVLATESDILASTLPVLGVKNGKLLDLEFQAAHHPLSHKIDNAEGRLFFLKHVSFVSPASHQLSLPFICQMQIHPHSQPEQSKKKPGM